ncbi:MAG: DUF4180 domain-containing protein [Clostridiaceae bacterium]|nr:DUF4180 domain-containing protein [Eubacteriales bacterium]
MNFRIVEKGGLKAAFAQGETPFLSDVQSALDLIAAASYEADAQRVALKKEDVNPDFFRLGTGLAGEILQKFTNYGMKVAFYGDFEALLKNSEPFRAFVTESNKGSTVFFAKDEDEAVERLFGSS